MNINLCNNSYISLKEMEVYKNKYLRKFLFFNNKKIIQKKITKHNEKFIEIELKKTNDLLSNINGYSLDNEQRKAVITDEESCLIVAGAGSGKTLTMMGKIRYLVEYKNIKPEEILCISFTNFTTDSLIKAINKQVNYNIDVYTFHKLGLKILKNNIERIKIAKDSLLSEIIYKFFKNDLLKQRNLLEKFVINYCLVSNIKLNNEDKNIYNDEEIIICNFLYFCDIKYIYKKIGIYNHKLIFAFYLPDYNIYIKHYMVDNTEEKFKINSYLDDIENIRSLFDCKVLETYSQFFTDGSVFEVLKTFFKENSIVTNVKLFSKIYEIFIYEGNKFKNLSKTILTFINMFKSYDYSYSKFEEIEKELNRSKKNKLLVVLEITKLIYDNYQLILKKDNMLDFNDMINLATEIIKENKVILKYKYIIIDEYQDTSFSRYNLIKTIKEQTSSKLIAVGDDFQSIYRFTGCDVDMFINFKERFEYSKILYLTNTYRNSKELIKVAGDFIMKNKYQIKKELNSNKSLNKPIKIYFYKDKNEIGHLFDKVTENNVFVLGRNNNDISFFYNNCFKINDDKVTFLKRNNMNIKFMSVHKSKGLESDGVVIINLEDKMLGFPSKCTEDILISYLNKVNVYSIRIPIT